MWQISSSSSEIATQRGSNSSQYHPNCERLIIPFDLEVNSIKTITLTSYLG